MKILVMGLPGSGKTTLAKKIAKTLKVSHINADEVRGVSNDWDFSNEGRVRQAWRMKEIAENHLKDGKSVVVDFVCPTPSLRGIFSPDFIIFMNTLNECKYENTNQIFERPKNPNITVMSFNQTEGHWFKAMINFIKEKIYL